jgi:choline dehydrogenase-like flavoprotein
VLANRLSESSSRNVLLLEAGTAYAAGDYPDILAHADRLGGGSIGAIAASRLGYAIAAQSGKVLGGGSAINAAVAKRALPNDFARWRRHGIADWEFEQALQCYRALENTPAGADEWHGRSGPLPIRQSTLTEVTKPLRALVETSRVSGFDRIDDFNGPVQHGVGIDPMNAIGGVRQNAGMAYLSDSVRQRPNLTVRGNARVDRIEFEGRRAAQVCLVDGATLDADEIIMSAGTYGSPAILLRSGHRSRFGGSEERQILEPLKCECMFADMPRNSPAKGSGRSPPRPTIEAAAREWPRAMTPVVRRCLGSSTTAPQTGPGAGRRCHPRTSSPGLASM